MQNTAHRKRWRMVLREQGRTMTWLARTTGVSFSSVNAYSQGVRRTPPEWLERVALVLGVPVEMLQEDREAA